MNVLLVTSDLALFSRVEALAQALGFKLDAAESAGGAVDVAGQGACRLAVLDLASLKCDASELVPRLKEAAPAMRVIAFAPHVHHQLLQAARQAGCDEVLTRGQFHARMEEILRPPAAQ